MSKKRLPVIVDGEEIGVCPGCGFTPIRASWMKPCDGCAAHVCRVCREETFECCSRKEAGAAGHP